MKIIIVILILVIILKLVFVYFEAKSLYIPTHDIKGNPSNLGLKYEEVNFTAKDGVVLNGWFIPVEGAKFTFLYCHGNWGNISDRLDKIKFFNKLGVNYFIFDYRGFGKSDGKPTENGLYNDAQAAFDYLLTRKDINKEKIVVYGKSLGGPIAADLCVRRKVFAMVLEGSFASVVRRAQQKIPFLPMGFLVGQRFDCLSKVKKIAIPKLIVHGKKDEIIPFLDGELIFRQAQDPKQFLSFDGGHNDDIYITSQDYKEVLGEFLTKNSHF